MLHNCFKQKCNFRAGVFGLIALVVILGIGGLSLAQIGQQSKEDMLGELNAKSRHIAYKEAEVNTKKLEGRVVGFSPRENPVYIGIAIDELGADYYFTIEEGVKVVRKGSLNDIQIGDTVEITYKHIKGKTSRGKEQEERRAAIVKFIRPKTSGDVLISR